MSLAEYYNIKATYERQVSVPGALILGADDFVHVMAGRDVGGQELALVEDCDVGVPGLG